MASAAARFEHVHVNEGGQAVIGNVRSGTAGEGHHIDPTTKGRGEPCKNPPRPRGRAAVRVAKPCPATVHGHRGMAQKYKPLPRIECGNHPHTIDRWDDATGENLIEQNATVGDYLVALVTYRAAVKRRRTRSRCATGRGCSRRVGGVNGRCSAHCAPPAGGVPRVRCKSP